MPSTTSYSFGDTILVPFPFTDQTSGKRRPAVVVCSQAYQQNHPDLILMAITSQVKGAQSVGEVLLDDWQGAGLLRPSLIKPVITTIEHRLVIRKLGQLNAQDRQLLKDTLQAVLAE